jgi:chromosome segregation ATPase
MNETNRPLKIFVVVFGIATVILAVLLINSRNESAERIKTVATLSNQVQQAAVELTDHKQTITNLETELIARKNDIMELSNTLATTFTNLNQSQNFLKDAQDELTKRNDAFAKLEAHNQALEARTIELNNVIASLTAKIEDISKKLTAAEGDKAALTAEVKRLTAERDDLQRKFSDLGALRAQVKKIKAEQNIARRLEWQRAGIQTMEPKAVEKITGTGAAAPAAKKAHYDLNVEIQTDGSVRVIPPIK